MLSNQHAARLRELAEPKECGSVVHWAESGFYDGTHLCDECKGTGVSVHPDAAALLAGAEALEAIEVAKAALVKVKDDMEAHMDINQNHAAGLLLWGQRAFLTSVAAYCTATLARLEGK